MYYILYLILLIIFIIYVIFIIVTYFFVDYNKKIYEWHCKHIYPFDKKLTLIEQEYIMKCINISYLELLRPLYYNSFLLKLSYFTFSHKYNKSMNSSRIAYGSMIFPDLIYEDAKKVLVERNIICEIEPNKNIKFGGLGWDIENEYFKIYFRFIHYTQLSLEYQKLISDFKNIWDSGLISLTYHNGNIIEKKIYTYPKNESIARLKSFIRSDIQLDVRHNRDIWKTKLNTEGVNLLTMYEKNGFKLDTITFKDSNDYSLYFPMMGN